MPGDVRGSLDRLLHTGFRLRPIPAFQPAQFRDQIVPDDVVSQPFDDPGGTFSFVHQA